jgi:chorismate mutase
MLAPVAAGVFLASGVTPAMAGPKAALAPPHEAVDSPRFPGGLGPLTDLAIQRLRVSDQVAAAKFGTGQPIDDPVREQQELNQVRQRAVVLGLNPTATVRFFQDQITASKIVQRGLFQRWTAHPAQGPATRPGLGTIRQQLDQLTTEMLHELVSTQGVRHQATACRRQLREARLSGEILNRLDALHHHALAVALASVCSPA